MTDAPTQQIETFEIEKEVTRKAFLTLMGRLIDTLGKEKQLDMVLEGKTITLSKEQLDKAEFEIELEVEDDEIELELSITCKR